MTFNLISKSHHIAEICTVSVTTRCIIPSFPKSTKSFFPETENFHFIALLRRSGINKVRRKVDYAIKPILFKVMGAARCSWSDSWGKPHSERWSKVRLQKKHDKRSSKKVFWEITGKAKTNAFRIKSTFCTKEQ